MSAFNKATDLPSSIATLEALAIWVAVACERLYYGEDYPINNTVNAPCAQYSVSKDNNGQRRVFAILAIPVSDNADSGTTPLWGSAQAINTVAIPNEFKA